MKTILSQSPDCSADWIHSSDSQFLDPCWPVALSAMSFQPPCSPLFRRNLKRCFLRKPANSVFSSSGINQWERGPPTGDGRTGIPVAPITCQYSEVCVAVEMRRTGQVDWPNSGEELTDLFVDCKKCSNSVLTICLFFFSFFTTNNFCSVI